MFLSLTITCVIAGAVLAAVHNVTEEPVAASKKAKLEDAIRAVAPPFDNSPSDEAWMAAVSAGDSLKIYPARKNGQLTGVAVESNSRDGFSGEIKIIAGLDASGKLLNYKVLEHAETPGLGSKMEEWFRTEKNSRSVLGRDLSSGALKVRKDGGDVDAITAATISSRAFLNAINRAYAAFSGKGSSDAVSGATGQLPDETPPAPEAGNADAASSASPVKSNPADSIKKRPALPCVADREPAARDTIEKTVPETLKIESPEPKQELMQHFYLGNETIPVMENRIEADTATEKQGDR
jgi:electron transport complex protein RnfG